MLTLDKMKHNLEVARLCYTLAKYKYNCSERFCRAMWTVGYTHDIGYEFLEKNIDNPRLHSDISDDMLFSAFHGDSYAIKWHGKKINQDDLSLRILNEADLQVDSKGNVVTVHVRLEDIKNRYGINSIQYEQSLWLAQELGLIEVDNEL